MPRPMHNDGPGPDIGWSRSGRPLEAYARLIKAGNEPLGARMRGFNMRPLDAAGACSAAGCGIGEAAALGRSPAPSM